MGPTIRWSIRARSPPSERLHPVTSRWQCASDDCCSVRARRSGWRAMETAPGPTRPSTPDDVARWLENRQEEIDSQFQYLAMADGEQRANVADVYRRLAAVEDKHAA